MHVIQGRLGAVINIILLYVCHTGAPWGCNKSIYYYYMYVIQGRLGAVINQYNIIICMSYRGALGL